MVINPIVRVYMPIVSIPIQGGMTIPNIWSLDRGTFHNQILTPKPTWQPLYTTVFFCMVILCDVFFSYLHQPINFNFTPWKINMEHTNHPFRKEDDLPNPYDSDPC